MKEDTSGKIRIENDVIFWDYRGENILKITLNEIYVIGEYTTLEGPGLDDWFFVFVNKNGDWKRISCYADNFESLLKFMSEKFQVDLKNVSLANSTKWKTVVRYPDYLKGKSLFKLLKDERRKSLLNRIKSSVIGEKKNIQLDDEVQIAIHNASR